PAGKADGETCVHQLQSRPPGEVADRRGAVPAEVAVGQLGERLLARQAPRPWQPLLEQDEGRLLALAWAEADQAVLREPPEHVHPALPTWREPGALEGSIRRRPRELAATLEIPDQQGGGPSQDALVDAEGAQATRSGGGPARRQQLGHPARVVGGDEVQRTPHRPGADDASVCDRPLHIRLARVGGAKANGPQCSPVILGLHRTERGDHGAGLAERTAGDPLRYEAPMDDLRCQAWQGRARMPEARSLCLIVAARLDGDSVEGQGVTSPLMPKRRGAATSPSRKSSCTQTEEVPSGRTMSLFSV